MRRLLYALVFALWWIVVLRPCWAEEPKPAAKTPVLSTADALKVREIQLRVANAKAELAETPQYQKMQTALQELNKMAQEIHQRTGCALRETDDGKLICADPPKPEGKKP